MSEYLGRSTKVKVELILHDPEPLRAERPVPTTGDWMVALMSETKLETPRADASREDIESLRGREVRKVESALPRFNASANENMIVEELCFDAESCLKRVLRRYERGYVAGVESHSLIGKSPKGKEIGECKPRHGGPPVAYSVMTEVLRQQAA